MSSSIPPSGPPTGDADHLGTGDGARADDPVGRGRRGLLVGGAAVSVAALVGGGAWAVTAFLGTGAQPSEALPASTLGYAAVDLDPGGEQKVEALRMLRRLPEFRESVGLDTDDDVRRYLFEETLGGSGCEVDYADDVEPWLGGRAAVAAVPGEDEPTPVLVLQVLDAEAAADGLAALRACAGTEEELAWVVEGEWAVLAPTEAAAREVVDAAAEATLADDADFIRWGEEVGGPGILTMYAAPEAGDVLAEVAEEQAASGREGGIDPFAAPGLAGLAPGGEVPEEVRGRLEAFEGAAATLRFDDGGLELEMAVDADDETAAAWTGAGAGADAVRALPSDTAAALGFGLPAGWSEDAMTRMESGLGPVSEMLLGLPFDDLVAMAEQQSGLSLPADVETLLGESLAVAVGGDFSLEAAEASDDGSEVPVGATVIGDVEGIERVLAQLDERFGVAAVVGHDAEGDTVAIGPSAGYRRQLLEEGGLGDAERFTDVVAGAEEAAVVLFVDLDAAWTAEVADDEVARNLEPLAGLGLSGWVEDGTVRSTLRLTTD